MKYGETSIITTVYTELFGLQSYIVNSVRASTKKGPGKANLFQPAAILDLVVYHNPLVQLQRIREFHWQHIYERVFSDVICNSVAQFMVELTVKLLKEPEANPELYYFLEDAFIHLDRAAPAALGNYPLFYAVHLASFAGIRLSDRYSTERRYLDLREGEFQTEHPVHPYFLGEPYSFLTSELLKCQHPEELSQIKTNQETRRVLLNAYEQFYALQVQDFGSMKTLPVLYAVLG